MVIFYKKWKKYNEIQLTKNKIDLNIRKMINHPPSNNRYMQREFQLKFSALQKDNDLKYTENSKK